MNEGGSDCKITPNFFEEGSGKMPDPQGFYR